MTALPLSLTPPQLASLEELAGRYPELVTLTHVDPVAVLCHARAVERDGTPTTATQEALINSFLEKCR